MSINRRRAVLIGVMAFLPGLKAVSAAPADAPSASDPRGWRAALGTGVTRRLELRPGVELLVSGEGERVVALLRVSGAAAAEGVTFEVPGGRVSGPSPQGHVRVVLADGDLAFVRPAAVQDDGAEGRGVFAAWAPARGGVQLRFPGQVGKLPLHVRFEVVFLGDPQAVERYDRNGNGSVELDELVPPSGPAPEAQEGGLTNVSASLTDTLVADAGTIGQANPGDVIGYTATVTATGPDPAVALSYSNPIDPDTTLVAGSVNVSPLALDDSYSAVGNLTLDVDSALAGLFGNDREFPVGTLTTFALASAGPSAGSQAACGSFPCVVTTAQGGSVTLKAPGDGRFTYSPPPALVIPGSDSFVYVITDSALTGTATVTFNVTGKVWFVDRDAPGGGNGTQAQPFNALTPATVAGVGGAGDVDGPNDIIYLYDRPAATDYTGGLQLESGQRLVGSGAPLIINGTTYIPGGTPPVLENTGGNALTLVPGTTVDGRPHVEGLTVGAANNAAIAGNAVSGTLALDSVTINTSASGAGLSLTNQAGSLTLTNSSIAGSGTGAALVLSGGAGSVSLQGAPINKTAGRLVDVQSKTGGTVTLGSVSGTGAATDAIVVQNNSGGSAVAFTAGFSVATTAGRGLFANNGGVIDVAGASSSISATGGAALDVTGTSFGAGLTLASASSTGSSAEGIKLANVTGPVTINGGALSGSTGTAFSLAQGSANVTYAGSITKSNAGRAVDVQTRAGGTVTFSGAVTASGASTGINVSGATAASTTTFSGAVDLGSGGSRLTGGTALTVDHGATASTTSFGDLEVFSNGQAGVNASNGGTLNVTTGHIDAQNGRALNADGLALGATFVTLVSSGSSSEGVRLNAATGSLTSVATTLSNPATQGLLVQGSSANADFGTTQVSGTGTQRILVTGSSGNVTFAGTTLTGGTDGVSLQNNSAGTRTFASLNVSGNTGIGFLHAVGGGATTVSGATTITNPGGTGVDIQNNTTAITFAGGVSVNKGASAGTGVSLATNATSPSFGVLAVSTSNGTGVALTSSGLTTSGGSIAATNGPALSSAAGAFAATFATVSSTNSPTQGISLTGASTGTLTMNGGTLSGSASTAFNVNGGSANVTYAGTVNQNNAQRVVDVQSTTGGTVSVATLAPGTSSTGVNINAANGNVTFTSLTHGTSGGRTSNQPVTINGGTGTYSLGAVSLFTSGSARGIVATNADGGLNSSAGTVDAAGAAAIDIDGPAGLTTLGMNLTSVGANGGANGLLVRDTNGSFSVQGTGVAGSGGSVQNMTARGARFTNAAGVSLAWMSFTGNGSNQDGAATCGDALNSTNTNCGAGIDLQGVNGVTLDRLTLSGGTQLGINGNDVTNLTITNSSVQNVGDEVLEDGVQLVNLKGTCAISDATLSGNFHRQLEVQNGSGTLDNLTLTRVTLDRGTYVSTAAQGLLVAGHGAGTAMTVTVKDSDFARNFGSGVFGQSIDTSSVTLVVGDAAVPANGNTFTNNSLSVQVVADNASTQTSTVANNSSSVTATVTSGSTPFSFRKSFPASGLVTHTMTANTLGTAAAQSGNNCAGCNGLTVQDEGTGGNMRMTITNNLIRHVSQRGMDIIMQLDDAMGVVVSGNTIQDPDGVVGQAVFGQSGNDATDAGTLCMDVTGNTVGGLWDTGVVPAGRNMRLRQAPAGGTTALRLRNIGGTTATDCNNFLNGNNTNALAGCSAGSGFTTGAAVCF